MQWVQYIFISTRIDAEERQREALAEEEHAEPMVGRAGEGLVSGALVSALVSAPVRPLFTRALFTYAGHHRC